MSEEVTENAPKAEKKPSPSRGTMWGAMITSLVTAGVVFSAYTAYLNVKQQANISSVQATTAGLNAEITSLQARLKSERSERIRSEDAVQNLMQSVQRYQDGFATMQAEMMQMRYDVNRVRKMPQVEVERRMQALNLLAAEVSVQYAKQQLWLNKRFDLAINQLEIARARVVMSGYEDNMLLAALDAAISSLGKLQKLHKDERVVQDIQSLSDTLAQVPFKPMVAETRPDQAEAEVITEENTWKGRLDTSLDTLKEFFVIQKGRTVDLSSLNNNVRAQVYEYMKRNIAQAERAFQAMDADWYRFNLAQVKDTFDSYYDSVSPEANAWLEKLNALQAKRVQVSDATLKTVMDKLDQALASFEPAMDDADGAEPSANKEGA